jgi:hypothetical protein
MRKSSRCWNAAASPASNPRTEALIERRSGLRRDGVFCCGDKLHAIIHNASPAMSVQALHGITLESLLTRLVEHYGWDALGRRIDINCFKSDPSIKSSLKFLRKTPWAREQVEKLYLETKFTN